MPVPAAGHAGDLRRVGRGRLAEPAGAGRGRRVPGRPPSTSTTGCGPARPTRPVSSPTPPPRFGAGFRAERVQVEPGPNLEARARAARHGGRCPPDSLLGHTADDQAETVLLEPAARRGPRRAGRHPRRRPPPDPGPPPPRDPRPLRPTSAWCRSTTRRTPIRVTVATGCGPRCCRCSTTSPSATWSRSSPARPACCARSSTCSPARPGRSIPTDAAALAAAPASAGARRGARVAA